MAVDDFIGDCDQTLRKLDENRHRPWHVAGGAGSPTGLYLDAKCWLLDLIAEAVALGVPQVAPQEVRDALHSSPNGVTSAKLIVMRLRAWAESLRVPPDAGRDKHPPKDVQPDHTAAAVEVLLSLSGNLPVLAVVRSDTSADEKMRAICGHDVRFLALDSPQWAELLDVSEGAIRKTKFWKADRPRAIEDGRM